ncbi:hypothetical protein [Cupriavidus taiwanensis]|uniref:hypothetical protein n=1 Tax=Cupriavidus taiwanensis TaxID=164546 RepID=UPI000E10B0A8|nr:hypothetical protein [Cupriavidus taiwanensis]SOY56817.1 conserved hypothetical protein [Cupriavidus taiwanensis]SOY90720.1 conserved hypothetical protein [Cupriavidus taiwanensis]SOZ63524.1 conserved hypothetical protein [Cupriavidus taiwanensis]SOZ82542.1 conserved hypothetical protein [Cupriavidus taiwanensis]SOZ84409.1 conserved hypothetical protein [Cupriavidus taiwanensis]
MPNAFTPAERQVAEAVSADPTNVANDNDIEAGTYMAAVARIVLMGDLSDRMMASLGRELLQQYERDVKGLVLSAERQIGEEESERAARTRRAIAELPAAVTFRLH